MSSTSDVWKAFRQLPVCDEHLPSHVVAVWDPLKRTMRYGPLDGMAFGLGAAVHQFNRVPAFVLALARRFLCIPVIGFYDDFRITDVAEANGSADAAFAELCAWLAVRLDPKKHQGPAPSIVFIGALEDSSCSDKDDEIILRPKPGRVDAIMSEIGPILSSKRCKPDEAASLFGKLMNLGTTYPCRVGRSQLAALSDHAHQESSVAPEQLLDCLRFHRALATLSLVRRVPLQSAKLDKVVVFSDASWGEGDTVLGGRICWWVVCESRNIKRGAVCDVFPRHLNGFTERKTQIIAAELFGVLFALLFDFEGLEHTSAMFFIDNMSGLCALVAGSSKAPDLAGLASGTHLGLARRSVWAWFEFVDSASNPTDGGSREGVSCPLAKEMGIPLRWVLFPSMPQAFPRPSPASWLTWWSRSASS